MNQFPRIETERLILRVPELADLDPWAGLMSDDEATRYIGGSLPRPLVWRGLMCMIGAWHATGVSMFSVVRKDTREWIGRIGPWQPEGWPGPEVGWSLRRDMWGHGYALEAAEACIQYAVDVLGWTQIVHTIDPANLASKSLAQRLGSSLIGPTNLPPPHQDAVAELWGQSSEQWRTRMAGRYSIR